MFELNTRRFLVFLQSRTRNVPAKQRAGKTGTTKESNTRTWTRQQDRSKWTALSSCYVCPVASFSPLSFCVQVWCTKQRKHQTIENMLSAFEYLPVVTHTECLDLGPLLENKDVHVCKASLHLKIVVVAVLVLVDFVLL